MTPFAHFRLSMDEPRRFDQSAGHRLFVGASHEL